MAKDSGIVNIHGKEYTTVTKRVDMFREQYKDKYGILTEIYSIDADVVVMKATITRLDDDKIVATGHAEEKRAASQINRTSAVENCETSAIGRALAGFGLAGTEFASADEVAHAVTQQSSWSGKDRQEPTVKQPLQGEATNKQREMISKKLQEQGVAIEDQKAYLIEQWGVEFPLQKQVASEVIDNLLAK